EMLPGHHGHQERGGAPTQAASTRLRVPKRLHETARLVARWHTHLHRVDKLKPGTVLKLLEAMDALRRPERLEDLIAVCRADLRGRIGFEHQTYPQADKIRQ